MRGGSRHWLPRATQVGSGRAAAESIQNYHTNTTLYSTQNYTRHNALKETTPENKMQIAVVRARRGEGLA